MSKNWKTAGLSAALIIVLTIPIYIVLQLYVKDSTADNHKAEFIGKERCIDCHKIEYDLWKDSHHKKAMAVATDSTVLGNFNNAKFVSSKGVETYFYKKDKKFFVKTEGIGGKIQELEITHTFGYEPLQQYLIPFDGGKYQCLPIAWDSDKDRWYSLPEMVYPDEDLSPGNWLYWTNASQNWNGMCAECHSTNVKKNFDPFAKTFNTTYSEINVSCEACHGPGSQHEDWANLPEMSRPLDNNFGLILKTSGITNREYVELCTRCHARRSQFDNYEHDRDDLLDSMLPELITENYHPDGQILEEDYVYGSFVQSKMFENDVQCNDCHNVHSGKLLFEGNALCAQCHRADVYDSKDHHFHKYKGEKGDPIKLSNRTVEIGEGALCINCHMPGQYYMGIDLRSDHSIRVPRPDLSITINTPNACNQCHEDKSSKWADDYITKWYGVKRKAHFGETFAEARESESYAEEKLQEIINDELFPLSVRATAMSFMDRYHSDKSFDLVKAALDDPEPLMRETAIRIYHNADLEEWKKDLLRLLIDPVKAVRAEAAIRLSELGPNEIPEKHKKPFEKAIGEFRDMNLYMADFPSGRMNLGVMYANLNKPEEAAKQYEEAIIIDSLFYPAKMNLSIIYSQLGRNDEAEVLLRDLVEHHPELPDSYYYLGLLLAEKQNYSEAVSYMMKASELFPERSRINYNAGLMLQYLGRNQDAENQLKEASQKEPNNFDYLYALADHYIKTNQLNKALLIGEKIKRQFPENQMGTNIINYINNLNETK